MTPQQEEKVLDLQSKLIALGFFTKRDMVPVGQQTVVAVITATKGQTTKVVIVEWDGSTW